MTISTVRALVRKDLKDEDPSTYRWTDNEIDRAIQRANLELSRYIPREMRTAVPTTAGSREVDISGLAGRISVERVEFPVDQTPRSFQRFSIYQNNINLEETEGDGSNCYVYWSAVHTINTTTNTVPEYLLDVLALGAAAYAVAALGQFRTDVAGIGGDKVDQDLFHWSKERLREFREALRRFGRDYKLKTSTLRGDI